MNYGQDGQFILNVKVAIEPRWIVPADSAADRMGREQTEIRMAALGNQLATFIRDALANQRTPEAWAETKHRLQLALLER